MFIERCKECVCTRQKDEARLPLKSDRGEERMLLAGKVAAISGAANPRGIGLATARLFAAHGARVAILDLDEAAAGEAAASLGNAHVGIACDLADRSACER